MRCPILVLFAHPALQNSRVNVLLMQAARNLEGVTLNDLYQAYPDFHIDVRHEQHLLRTHEIIVFQYPLLWFSAPALLKEWQDLVLEHGWAYGIEGRALRGKKCLCALTTGGGEAYYTGGGEYHFSIRELLAPMEQTARLCGMDFLPPFVIHGTHRMDGSAIRAHAESYRRVLEALRDGRVDLARVRSYPRFNSDLDAVIRNEGGRSHVR
jgi:glutathione-regulated potassium-efflux system ancillary protein KefG